MAQSEKYSGYGYGEDDDDEDDIVPAKRRFRISALPRRLQLLIFLLVVGAGIGVLISLIVCAVTDVPVSQHSIQTGVKNGLTISFLLWIYLALIEPAGFGRFLKRRPFIIAALIRECCFFLLIIIGLTVNRMFAVQAMDVPGWPIYFLDGGLVRDAVLALVFSIAVFFVIDVAEMVGPRILRNIILGRYHNPVTEERVFLFLDVRGATALAERIGDELTHEFLTQFFADIDRIMVRWRGEVVTYLGDGVMITWPLEEAIERSAPLGFLADVMKWVVKTAPDYKRDFGSVPTFRAGLHGGGVVAGECGDSKREIAYIGDVVNIAARLEEACKRTQYVALATAELVEKMTPPEGMVFDRLGNMRLAGRERQIDVVAIRMVRARTSSEAA